MALATKCPHCNTIFRVAHDQLKLRGGIVRCGSCNQVFDGNAALLESLPPPSPPLIPPAAAANPLDVDVDVDVEQGSLPGQTAVPAMAMAPASLPDSVAALSLEFDDAPAVAAAETTTPQLPAQWRFRQPEPVSLPEPLPALDPLPVPLPEPVLSEPEPEPEPTAQDLLGGDTLSEEELQTAIEAELAALDARMAAAVPAPALSAEPEAFSTEPGASTLHSDERREPTLDFSSHPDQLGQIDQLDQPGQHNPQDQQARQPLATRAAPAYDDIPPSHTLLRTASAPPADRYAEPALHHTETLVAESAVDRLMDRSFDQSIDRSFDQSIDHSIEHHTLEPAVAAQVAPADDEPGFVKRERHRERYGRATTIALCLGIVLMLVALLAQGLTTFRNPLAAAMPSLKPTLVAACKTLGCRVELPSQIDELAIEQGELQTLSENTFSFSTALKNSSGSAQAWPHIELVLDDANDKTVLRRVFAPRDYLGPEVDIAQGFAARSEQAVKLYFELKQPRASGYHIAVFYP